MAPVTPRWGSWKFENYQKWSRDVPPIWQSPANNQNHWFRLCLRSKRTKIAIFPLFSIVFYSKTIGKQRKLSEWVSPERSRAEFWHKAFLYSVDSNCKRFLETYFFNIKVTWYRSCGSDRIRRLAERWGPRRYRACALWHPCHLVPPHGPFQETRW